MSKQSWQQDTPTSLEKQLFLFLGRNPSRQWKCVGVSFALSISGQPNMTLTLLDGATGLIEHLPVTDSAILASLSSMGQACSASANSVLAAIIEETAGSTNISTSKRIR